MTGWSTESLPLLKAQVLCVAAAGAILSGACSLSDPGTLAPAPDSGLVLASVTSYGSGNAFTTTGTSERELAPDRFSVRAKGSAVTPPDRLTKIALARAAEIGVEQKYPYFKAGTPAASVLCKAAREGNHRSGNVAAVRTHVVDIEVVYAKDQADPSFMASAQTFERLTSELDGENVGTDAKAAAAALVAQRCGK